MNNNNACPFKDITNSFPEKAPLGMAYVPFQKWEEPLPENQALEEGAIFPGLIYPFTGRAVHLND